MSPFKDRIEEGFLNYLIFNYYRSVILTLIILFWKAGRYSVIKLFLETAFKGKHTKHFKKLNKRRWRCGTYSRVRFYRMNINRDITTVLEKQKRFIGTLANHVLPQIKNRFAGKYKVRLLEENPRKTLKFQWFLKQTYVLLNSTIFACQLSIILLISK